MVVTLNQRRGITYVPVGRPLGYWTVLTVLLLESVHEYVTSPNAQPAVVTKMEPVQSSTKGLQTVRVH